jgi:hypothetical protein
MLWTRIVVTSWHSRVMSRSRVRSTARMVVGSWATVLPGGLASREYGSMPVTSPARHSITLSLLAPRSTKIAMWPDSTTYMPWTVVSFRVSTSPSPR